jgi:hypothetical protein
MRVSERFAVVAAALGAENPILGSLDELNSDAMTVKDREWEWPPIA